jgi:hypothetical protein
MTRSRHEPLEIAASISSGVHQGIGLPFRRIEHHNVAWGRAVSMVLHDWSRFPNPAFDESLAECKAGTAWMASQLCLLSIC